MKEKWLAVLQIAPRNFVNSKNSKIKIAKIQTATRECDWLRALENLVLKTPTRLLAGPDVEASPTGSAENF